MLISMTTIVMITMMVITCQAQAHRHLGHPAAAGLAQPGVGRAIADGLKQSLFGYGLQHTRKSFKLVGNPLIQKGGDQ